MIPEMEGLAKRIERLERQNRFLKRGILAVFSLVIVSGLWAQSRTTRTIEAEKFVLLDSQGRARITIGTPQSSGLAIGMPVDEPSIWISDAKGVEATFRYNNRKQPTGDSGRFVTAMKHVFGRRLTYSQLTGKDIDSLHHETTGMGEAH